MSCGRCSVWQHITCHNLVDEKAGRPPRNWESVDFICRRCTRLSQHAIRGTRIERSVPNAAPRVNDHLPFTPPNILLNGRGSSHASFFVKGPILMILYQ